MRGGGGLQGPNMGEGAGEGVWFLAPASGRPHQPSAVPPTPEPLLPPPAPEPLLPAPNHCRTCSAGPMALSTTDVPAKLLGSASSSASTTCLRQRA